MPKIEIDYSKERSKARENGASEDEIKEIDAEWEEEMTPYVYKFKVVAAILVPLSTVTICLYRLGPEVHVFAHSEVVPLPVAKLVDEV